MLFRLGTLSDTDSPLRSFTCIDIGSAADGAHSAALGTAFTTNGTKRIDLATATGAASLRFHIEK